MTLAYWGVSKNATAVPVIADSELSEMSEAYQPGFLVRLLTGLPPREFVRLDDMP